MQIGKLQIESERLRKKDRKKKRQNDKNTKRQNDKNTKRQNHKERQEAMIKSYQADTRDMNYSNLFQRSLVVLPRTVMMMMEMKILNTISTASKLT